MIVKQVLKCVNSKPITVNRFSENFIYHSSVVIESEKKNKMILLIKLVLHNVYIVDIRRLKSN